MTPEEKRRFYLAVAAAFAEIAVEVDAGEGER